MLVVWFNAILILLESLYQVVLYIYKLSDRDKIPPLIINFVEKRKMFFSRWRKVPLDDGIIYKMIGRSKVRTFVWFIVGILFYVHAKGRGGEIGTYVIFTTVMFTNVLKQIYFYKYKKSLKGEKFSKVLRSIIEIEIGMYNVAFDTPIEKNSIYEVIKDTWVNIFGSMSVIILVFFASYFGVLEKVSMLVIIIYLAAILSKRFIMVRI
ncbi:hypothetical protein [Thermoanaerobacter uzonensis]|uniref:hypothetical protein n=1 Tax=Thermoanaerobacter uzonensis TaxID=447593 RepID=UPI003D768384